MKKSNGFSLIELMIVVVIVGILAKVAFPAYQSYVLKSHRTAAINAIMDLGSREARYYTTNNAYTTNLTTLGYASAAVTGGTSTTYYNLSVVAASAPAAITMMAAPAGTQTSDSCGTYTYTDLGQKGITTGTLSDCWKQ